MGFNQVTSTGWLALIDFLRSPNFGLRELDLSGSYIDNDTVIAFTSDLTRNKTLEWLSLEYCTDEFESALITERGWDAISALICNQTSIIDTYTSNHILHKLGDHDAMNLTDDIVSYLKLNKNKDKAEVARQKILQTHFSTGDNDTSNLQVFLDLELEMMPTAMNWIGRPTHANWRGTNVSGLSLLYNLMKRVPDLFDSSPSPQKKLSKGKRKREMSI